MQRLTFPTLAVVLFALSVSTASAAGVSDGRGTSLAVEAFGGVDRFSRDANLGVAGASDASAGAKSNALAGLRVGLGLGAWAAVEVELLGMLTSDRTYDRRATLFGYRLNAIAYLLPGSFRPFVLVGGGVLEVVSTHAQGAAGLVRDRDGEVHAGVGVDYRLLDHLSVRADARAMQVPGKQVWSVVTDLEGELGVVLRFGAGPRVAAASETLPAMPDASAREPPVPPPPSAPPPTSAARAATQAPPALPAQAAVAPVPASAEPRSGGEPPSPSPAPPPAPTPAPTSPAPPAPTAAPKSPPVAARLRPVPPATPAPAIVAPRLVPTRVPLVKELLGRAKEIQFDGPSSSKLSVVSLPLLGQLAEALVKDPSAQIEIVAHTGGSGDAAKDRALSKRRAEAVKRALVEREVGPSRLLATGRGSDDPLAPSITRSGRKLNERVELRFWTPEKMSR